MTWQIHIQSIFVLISIAPSQEEISLSEQPTSNMVVVMGNNANGRPKCFTTASVTGSNAAGATSISRPMADNADDNLSVSTPSSDKNETCI